MARRAMPPPDAPVGPEPIGQLLRRLRLAKGFSQLRLAERLCDASRLPTISRHEVSRWEREERIPGSFWLRWLAVVLDVPLEQLEAATAAARICLPGRPFPSGLHRRLYRVPTAAELLSELDHADIRETADLVHAWLTGTPSVDSANDVEDTGPLGTGLHSGRKRQHHPADDHEVASAGELQPVLDRLIQAGLVRPESGGLGYVLTPDQEAEAVLGYYEERLQRLRRMDDQVGGVVLAPVVDRELRNAIAILDKLDGSRRLRGRALLLVANLAQLSGWTHSDAGGDRAARQAYRMAFRAAALGGDRNLAAYVLSSLSRHVLSHDPNEALLLAKAGLYGIKHFGSPLNKTLLLQRIALAEAHAGQRHAAEVALAEAEREAEQVNVSKEPAWLYWADEAELVCMTGRCLAVLGRHQRAAELLEASGLSLRSVAAEHRSRMSASWSPRTHALYAAFLARCYLQMGEVEEACRIAASLHKDAAVAGSVRAAAAARYLHVLLLNHRSFPEVRKYEAWTGRPLPALTVP